MPYPNLNLDDLLDGTLGCCFYCGRLLDARYGYRPRSDWILVATGQRAEIEHMDPRRRGGDNNPGNLLPACHRCNAAKGIMTRAEFRLLMGLRRRSLSNFAFEEPAIERDWICVHSDEFERRLLHHNFPQLAATYKTV